MPWRETSRRPRRVTASGGWTGPSFRHIVVPIRRFERSLHHFQDGQQEGDMAIDFRVNGRAVSVDVPDGTRLLWVLREELGLTGTKYGCGAAQCGACTVHIDGQAVRSCVMPVSAAEGRRVTTIEGVSGKVAQAVQEAWNRLDVVQCGYCQSGQIMSAIALLSEVTRPSDTDIDAAMTGNVCRCATYVRIRAAIHDAAQALGGTR